jgi:hypothetical protein
MLAHRVLMTPVVVASAFSDGVWYYNVPGTYVWYDDYDVYYVFNFDGAFVGSTISGFDSVMRPYVDSGGKRYTKGRTVMGGDGTDLYYYKICRTATGVNAPETGD